MSIRFDLDKDKKDIQVLEKCECVSVFMQLNAITDRLVFIYEFLNLAKKSNEEIQSYCLPAMIEIVGEQMDAVYRICLMLYPKNDFYGAEEMKEAAKKYA